MQDDEVTQTDAEFWGALAVELQDKEEPAIQFVGADPSDHVFNETSVNLDEPAEPEPIPSWGECFTW